MRLNDRRRLIGETDGEFFARETAKQQELLALPFTDVNTSTLPVGRAQRAKWRLQAGQVVTNLALPDPPHPRQQLLDQLAFANTVPELKLLLDKVIRG